MSTDLEFNEDFIPIPLETVPLETPLPFPLYVKVAGKWVCFRAINDTLTKKRVETLGERIDTISVTRQDWNYFLEYLERICTIESKDMEKVAKNMRTLLLTFGKHLEESKGLEKNAVNKLRALGIKLADLLYSNPKLIPHLMKRYQQSDVYYASHSTNVAIYSLAIAHKLKFSLEDARLLAFSCLVHNIGNSVVSPELLYKAGKLSEEEFKEMQRHAQQGSEILEYMDAPTEAIFVARQHHEKMDGTGYPLNLKNDEIHVFSKICSIADVYDALLSNKPSGTSPLKPDEAIEQMRSMKGKFDPVILSTISGNA